MSHSSAVIDLDARRARMRHARGQRVRRQASRRARTVMLQVSHGDTYRYLGIDDSLHLHVLGEAINLSFGLKESAPTVFLNHGRLNPHTPIFYLLGRTGDEISFRFGLWRFSVTTVESWPREPQTPWALCVGGAGDFGDNEFDISAINQALTGDDATKEVLSSAHPRVRKLITQSKVHDLIPLLQAVDLQAEVRLSHDVKEQLEAFRQDTDGFYAHLLAGSSFSGRVTAKKLVEALVGDQEEGLPEGLKIMISETAPVDRLDIYRYLLKAPANE